MFYVCTSCFSKPLTALAGEPSANAALVVGEARGSASAQGEPDHAGVRRCYSCGTSLHFDRQRAAWYPSSQVAAAGPL